MHKCVTLLLGIACLISAIPAFSHNEEKSLSQASLSFLKKNHFASHVSLPFEDDINFNYRAKHRRQNVLNFKPVIPFNITPSYDLIIRTIAPIYERVPLPNQHQTIGGIGNINPTFFISPNAVDKWVLGLGPTVFLPTTTNAQYLASNQWTVGPELAAMAILEHWMYGVLTYNVYNKSGSNQFSFQYLLGYTFDNGWYISTNPNITANWQNEKDQRWVVPFGLGAGKSFNLGKQAIVLSSHAYYNAVRPSTTNSPWQLQLEMEFLFPE